MKVFYLILFTVLSLKAVAQDSLISLPMQDGKIFYQKVYDVNATKDELFLRAKSFFLRSFPNTKDVIQDADKESGIISGKGNFNLSQTLLTCTIRIFTKDGKYKAEIFDFYPVEQYGDGSPLERGYAMAQKKQKSKKSWRQFNDRVLQMFDQIETQMNKKTEW
jgi:hypothetical protein